MMNTVPLLLHVRGTKKKNEDLSFDTEPHAGEKKQKEDWPHVL